MTRTVLIITYYWFPSEGTGVYRISRFAKYLKHKGWKLVILTAEQTVGSFKESHIDPEYSEISVYRSRIWEPLGLFKKFAQNKKNGNINISPAIFLNKKASWKVRLSAWIRLNLFIPDAKIFWRNPAVKLGKEIIRKEKPELIFSTSPPPSTTLIAMDLANWSGLPWVADFRDPWTRIYYLENAPITPLANRINENLERKALEAADHITAVNDGFFPHLNIEHKQTRISNGYDPQDYPNLTPAKPSEFIIRYFGQWKENQQPSALFDVLKQLSNCSEYREKIALECYGTVTEVVKNKLRHPSIQLRISFHPFLSKRKAIKLMLNAEVLLLIIGRSNIEHQSLSTKLFDYLYTQRPILGYGPPNGSAAKILQSTGCGNMFNFEDRDGGYNFIVQSYQAWKKNTPFTTPNARAIAKFDFENLTSRLIEVFQNVLWDEGTSLERS